MKRYKESFKMNEEGIDYEKAFKNAIQYATELGIKQFGHLLDSYGENINDPLTITGSQLIANKFDYISKKENLEKIIKKIKQNLELDFKKMGWNETNNHELRIFLAVFERTLKN